MYNYLSSPNLSDVTFTANLAPSGDGGGMYNYASSPRLVNVLFEKNKANVSRRLGWWDVQQHEQSDAEWMLDLTATGRRTAAASTT